MSTEQVTNTEGASFCTICFIFNSCFELRKGPEKAHRNSPRRPGPAARDRRFGLGLVQRDDDFRRSSRRAPRRRGSGAWDDRRRFEVSGKWTTLRMSAAVVAARAAHDVDRVLVARVVMSPTFAPFSDDGVGADRGAVREKGDVAAEALQRQASACAPAPSASSMRARSPKAWTAPSS